MIFTTLEIYFYHILIFFGNSFDQSSGNTKGVQGVSMYMGSFHCRGTWPSWQARSIVSGDVVSGGVAGW